MWFVSYATSPFIVIVYDISIVIVYDISILKPFGKNWLYGSMGNGPNKYQVSPSIGLWVPHRRRGLLILLWAVVSFFRNTPQVYDIDVGSHMACNIQSSLCKWSLGPLPQDRSLRIQNQISIYWLQIQKHSHKLCDIVQSSKTFLCNTRFCDCYDQYVLNQM